MKNKAKKGGGGNPPSERPVGRPSDFTPEIAEYICGKIAEGKSMRSICAEDSMPSLPTVFSWMRKFPEFLKQYETAMEMRAVYYSEELMEIADDGTNDWMLNNRPDNPGWVANGEALQRSRLRVDTRKWVASKLLPKKYGDKVGVEHSGKVEGLAINIDLGDK